MTKKIEHYQIVSKFSNLKNAVDFNDCILGKTHYTLTVEQFERRIQHQMDLEAQMNHAQYQLDNYEDKCGGCDKALLCMTKCIV